MSEPADAASPPHRLPRWAAAVSILLIALVPIVPVFFSANYPGTHEPLRYEQLTMLFADAIANGHLYPRWLPSLAGGHGYPTFVFYQPLVFWVGSALSWTGLPPSSWVYVGNYLFFLIGAAGAYRLARLFCARGVSLAGAALFVLTPYLFVNLHIRGDQSELASSLLLPWTLWAMVSLRQRVLHGRGVLLPAIVGGIAIAGTVMAHPIPALLALPLLGLLFLFQTGSVPAALRGGWVRSGLSVCAIGLALSLPYWMCVVQFSSIVHLDRTTEDYFRAELHIVSWKELLALGWRFGVSAGEGTEFGQMSLQLGAAHALLALAGLIAGRKNGWVRLSACAYLLLVLLMTPATLPLWTREWFPLRSIQFPWRAFSVVATFQFMMILGLLAVTRRAPVAWALTLLAAGTQWQMYRVSPWPVIIAGEEPRHMTWREASESIRDRVRTMPQNYVTFANVHEFDPLWMAEPPEPRGDAPKISSLERVTMSPTSTPYHIRATVETSKPSGVLLHQIYFPGWHIEVNGERIDDATLRSAVLRNGTMVVPVGAGTSIISAHYDGPPGGTLRLALAAIVIVIAGGTLLHADRFFRRATPSPQPQERAPGPSHSLPAEGASRGSI